MMQRGAVKQIPWEEGRSPIHLMQRGAVEQVPWEEGRNPIFMIQRGAVKQIPWEEGSIFDTDSCRAVIGDTQISVLDQIKLGENIYPSV